MAICQVTPREDAEGGQFQRSPGTYRVAGICNLREDPITNRHPYVRMHSSNEAQNKQVLVGAWAWRQTSSTLQFSVILDFHKGNAAPHPATVGSEAGLRPADDISVYRSELRNRMVYCRFHDTGKSPTMFLVLPGSLQMSCRDADW